MSNHIIFAQRRKTGDDKGNGKYKEQKLRRNLDHITCNYRGEKYHYAGNSEFSTQTKLKEDTGSFRKMKQENLLTCSLLE